MGICRTIAVLALVGLCQSCVTDNEAYRLLSAECSTQQHEIRQTFHAVIKELDKIPQEQRVQIFRLLKDRDEKIQKFRQKHGWHGSPDSISDLIKAGKITDPTTGPTVPPETGASGVQ